MVVLILKLESLGNVPPIDQADVGAGVTVDHSLEFPVPIDGSQLPNNENGKSNLIFISLVYLYIIPPITP